MWIPKLYNGKNKTFWFFDYEGLKQRQNQFAITAVPTAAMWNGDLSSITDYRRRHFTIYDPATTTGPNGVRSPFPNNVIPAGRISQTAKTFRASLPRPISPAGTRGPTRTFRPTIPCRGSTHLDHQDRPDVFGEGQHLRTIHEFPVHQFPSRRTLRLSSDRLHELRRHAGRGFQGPLVVYPVEPRVFADVAQRVATLRASLAHPLRNAGRQHQLGEQAGVAQTRSA